MNGVPKKVLVILRGVPGAGKSTLANYFASEHIQGAFTVIDTDDFPGFYKNGKWNFTFDASQASFDWTIHMLKDKIKQECHSIVVCSCFTNPDRLQAVSKLGRRAGYMVFSLVVEKRHNGRNCHDVAVDKIRNIAKALFATMKLA